MIEYTQLRLGVIDRGNNEEIVLLTEDNKVISYVEKLTIEQNYSGDLPTVTVVLVAAKSNELLSRLRK